MEVLGSIHEKKEWGISDALGRVPERKAVENTSKHGPYARLYYFSS